MDDPKDEIESRVDYPIMGPEGAEVPEFFIDMVRDGEFREDHIYVDTMPLGDEGPWTTSGIPIVESAPSYGNMMAAVRMPVEDFRDLQEYIGTELRYPDTRPITWWDVNPDRVESIAAVLRGDEEPDEIFGGIPRPYIKVGTDGSLLDTQEGRHRTVAAEEVGLDSIPVTIMYNTSKEGEGGKYA